MIRGGGKKEIPKLDLLSLSGWVREPSHYWEKIRERLQRRKLLNTKSADCNLNTRSIYYGSGAETTRYRNDFAQTSQQPSETEASVTLPFPRRKSSLGEVTAGHTGVNGALRSEP